MEELWRYLFCYIWLGKSMLGSWEDSVQSELMMNSRVSDQGGDVYFKSLLKQLYEKA